MSLLFSLSLFWGFLSRRNLKSTYIYIYIHAYIYTYSRIYELVNIIKFSYDSSGSRWNCKVRRSSDRHLTRNRVTYFWQTQESRHIANEKSLITEQRILALEIGHNIVLACTFVKALSHARLKALSLFVGRVLREIFTCHWFHVILSRLSRDNVYQYTDVIFLSTYIHTYVRTYVTNNARSNPRRMNFHPR